MSLTGNSAGDYVVMVQNQTVDAVLLPGSKRWQKCIKFISTAICTYMKFKKFNSIQDIDYWWFLRYWYWWLFYILHECFLCFTATLLRYKVWMNGSLLFDRSAKKRHSLQTLLLHICPPQSSSWCTSMLLTAGYSEQIKQWPKTTKLHTVHMVL